MNIYRLMTMIWVSGFLGMLDGSIIVRAMESPTAATTYRNQNVTITIQHPTTLTVVNVIRSGSAG